MPIAIQPSPIQEHPEFFLPDGDVVLLAGADPTVAFRLHRDIVSKWSPKFYNMLDVLDSDDALTFKGYKAVELNDSSFDLERLVRVLYDETGESLPTQCTSHTFTDLASVLLLSQKYGITHLFDDARLILLAEYPLTLAAWDAREAYEFTPAARYNRIESIRRRAPPLGVVSLSLQLNAPYLLVPAYLDLARLPSSEIIRGFTIAAPIVTHPAGTTLHLSHRETTAVLYGKEALQRLLANFIKHEVESRPPVPQCHNLLVGSRTRPSPCAAAFARVAREMLALIADTTRGVDSDPLFVLSCASDILRRDAEASHGQCACTVCVAGFRQSVNEWRQHVWGCLDECFGLCDLPNTRSYADG